LVGASGIPTLVEMELAHIRRVLDLWRKSHPGGSPPRRHAADVGAEAGQHRRRVSGLRPERDGSSRPGTPGRRRPLRGIP
jgi:hypothetical protein